MNPFDLGMGNPLYVDPNQAQIQPPPNPFLQAITALLAQAKTQAPQPIPRHYGPAEGPLGENAHLGWGQTPKTAASPRKAAPTPRTKLGGYLGGARAPVSLPPLHPHYSSPADIIRRLLSGQFHLSG